MINFFFLLSIFLFEIISQTNENPIKLIEDSYPFILALEDEEHYYLITNNLKIEKESGNITNQYNNELKLSNFIYISDNLYNNYIYVSNNYYYINYSSSISFQQVEINFDSRISNPNSFTMVDSIANNNENDFITYGYKSQYLIICIKSLSYCFSYSEDTHLSNRLTCKFINGTIFICARYINSRLTISCFEYKIYLDHPEWNSLEKISNSLTYELISIFGLYDTDKYNIKILCKKGNDNTINCNFFEIIIENQKSTFNFNNNLNLAFTISEDWSEKNCYFSKFISENIFCCAITNKIHCYIISSSNNNIKEFQISQTGENSYLTMKNSDNFLAFFFMNNNANKNSIYEFYIRFPKCEDKYYYISNNSLNENKSEENKEKLSDLVKAGGIKYYFEIKNPPINYGYFTLNNNEIKGSQLISNNDNILDFIVNNTEITFGLIIRVNYTISIVFEDENINGDSPKECHFHLQFKTCYNSCETCSVDFIHSNEEQHNCLKCKKNYYHSPENITNCYLEKDKKLNWYFDGSGFGICNKNCRTCDGPTEYNCLTCYQAFYLENGNCTDKCSDNYIPQKAIFNQDYYYVCIKCHKHCKTCSNTGNFNNMNCRTCKENHIKYNNNCFEINNSSIKSFFVTDDKTSISSCFEKFKWYIKEEFNECIPLPNEDEGYFITNNETGLLSKCHDNCFSCKKSPNKNTSGNIVSMECLICKESNSSEKTMIKIDNNCFKIIQYEELRIIFNISEIQPDNPIGTCKDFGKAIYYGDYECIDKPNNTYYVLNNNDTNTGVIKNCNEIFNIPFSFNKYYINSTDNIYYACYPHCKSCNGSYNNETRNMFCLDCTDGYYFIYGENNCYNFTLLQEAEYYFNSKDSKFHKCYHTCSKCLNFEPNETNHSCIECISGYYFLDSTNNCYDMNLTKDGYYLDNIDSGQNGALFKKCYNTCKTCEFGMVFNESSNEINHNCKECSENYYKINNYSFPNNCYSNETINELLNNKKDNICLNNTFYTPEGDCVYDCLNGTYKFFWNNSCLETCPHNYEINNNECTFKSFDEETSIDEFKNQIKDDIVSHVNSSKIINGSNFLAVISTSDKIDPEEQLSKGISAVVLGNCTNVIKEHYNISKEETLIILNIESKNDKIQNNESNNNDDKSFNLGKSTQLEIYDYSGRKLDISVCKESIKVMKYIGDAEQLDIDSAKALSEQGIDVFNAADDFFNDICHQPDNSNGKDMILKDRRTDIYQNVSFCQDGCTYNGINYNLKAANCLCNSNSLKGGDDNVTNTKIESASVNFKTLKETVLANLFNFNFNIVKCYNLAFNTKILIHNIGFYCLALMFVLQIIFFIVYSIKTIKPLKIFMLLFNSDKNKNNQKTINSVKAIYIQKKNKRIIKSSLPIKNNSSKALLNNNNKRNHYINSKLNANQKGYRNHKNGKKEKKVENQSNLTNILKISNDSKSEKGSKKNFIISNNFAPTINIKVPIVNIENNLKDETNDIDNIMKSNNHHNMYNDKRKANLKCINIMETLSDKNINNLIIPKKNNESISKLLKNDSDIQNMDYEEAIIFDKRSILRMYWGFLVDSQIILGTFCTENYLDLFVIKLSFLVCTFQISFFLNALFYTDEYISDAYHNDGVLDFFSGLPKSIYSFIATTITTNLLSMLSSSKSELMRAIKRNNQYKNYVNIIHIKLAKLQKKLIIYFILVFLLESFFLYYVTTFCAVYRFSQKYWFLGCLESFGMDSFVSLITCIFLSLLRYISIKNHIKCAYIVVNIISVFL